MGEHHNGMQDHGAPITPDESAILKAIESSDGAGGEDVGRRLEDTPSAHQLRGMIADRALLRSLGERSEPAPPGLLAGALEEALGDVDASVLARLGNGPTVADGLPVSAIEPYRESISLKLWRNRRTVGMLSAAAIVFALGIGIVAGVRAIGGAAVPDQVVSVDPDSISVNPLANAGAELDGSAISGDEAPDLHERAFIASRLPAATDPIRVLDSVFEAAPLIETGRVIIYARAGSNEAVDEALSAIGDQDIGPDHSFEIHAADASKSLWMASIDSMGLPELSAPVMMSEDGQSIEVAVPVRSGWLARVRRSPTALAALRKHLEEIGMVVEFRMVDEALHVPAGPNSEDVLWWSSPATTWDRTSFVPVVIDSLPE